MKNNIELYATVFGTTKVVNEDNKLIAEKLRVGFYDEYDEKRDSTPTRELKIHNDKIGRYVMHNHQRYYLEKLEEK